jgi:hypothetical protein
MRKRVHPLALFALAGACSQVLAVDQEGAPPKPTNDLLNIYQGAQAHMDQGRVRIIYGTPMGGGVTPRASATDWLTQNGEAFACGPLQLVEEWSTPVMDGRFTVFGYKQLIDGVPVERGIARVLVLNGPLNQVVYASGNLAPRPENGFPRVVVSSDAALKIAGGVKEAQGLTRWGAPVITVFQGDGDWIAPVLTWKVTGQAGVELAKTFFVDASSGRVVYVRDDVVSSDVSGTVQGMGSPGVYPDALYNPPAPLNMPEIRASITGGSSVFSDRSGAFTIPNAGAGGVTVTAGTNDGRWVSVTPGDSNYVSASAAATPPGPANLMLNSAPAEQLTAQVNAFVGATLTHNYFKDRAPAFGGLDVPITAYTGVGTTCNALFNASDLSINFFNSGGGCVNTAYSTVISHEYGHFIVNRLNLAQNAFGEGYGDLNASMVWDDDVIGRGWNGTAQTFIRDPIAANIQYPCSGSCGNEIHCCGQVISGVWWRIRQNMGALLGTQPGLEATRNLEVAWSLMTTGGPSSSTSAGPGTAIEVLTVDDNDGTLLDGSPHFNQICSAFAAHGISCPVLQPTTFQYPDGHPTTLVAGVPASFPVNILGGLNTPMPGTGALSYRIGLSGPYATLPMAQGNPDQYTATLPAITCATVQYYFSVQTTDAQTLTDPPTAPTEVFSAVNRGASTVTVADLNFDTDPGWTVTNDPSLTTGAWERAIPHTPPSTNCPPADFNGGGSCWVTDNRAGNLPNYDVDGGPTRLTTSVFDLSAYSDADVTYARWIRSTGSAGSTPDFLVVEVSVDNGTNWTLIESAGDNAAGWVLRTIRLRDYVSLTSQTRFRFSVDDTPNDSVTEAGIDAFKIVGYVCPPACYANCDGSTTPPVLNVRDFTCFLQRYAAGDSYANCDGSTVPPVLNVADFTCFLQKFGAGCP